MNCLAIIISILLAPACLIGQNINWSVGAELIPVGGYDHIKPGMGGGVSGSFDYTVLPKFTVGLNTGFIYVSGQEENWIILTTETGPYYILPVEITTKYYFNEPGSKAFVGLRMGPQFFSVHSRVTTRTESVSNTSNQVFFGFTPEYGYHFTPKFSSSIRLQYAFRSSTTETTNSMNSGIGGDPQFESTIQQTSKEFRALAYIALRMAWHFN